MPENSGRPAIAWPTPTVNGLRKAPAKPAPGADQGDRAADHFVVAEPSREEHQTGQEGQRLLRHADRAAADREEQNMSAGRTTSPRPRAAATMPRDQRVEGAGRLRARRTRRR